MGMQALCPDNSFLAMTERSFTTVRMERERGMPASGSLTHQKGPQGQGLLSVPSLSSSSRPFWGQRGLCSVTRMAHTHQVSPVALTLLKKGRSEAG